MRAAENEKEPVRRNVTDPDSRLMPVRGGRFAQGYNPQNVTSEDGLVLADAGYLPEHNLTCPGPAGSSSPASTATWKKPPRRPSAGSTRGKKPIAAMTARLAAEDSIAAYRRRSHVGETDNRSSGIQELRGC